MSMEAQVDMDWAGMEVAESGAGAVGTAPGNTGSGAAGRGSREASGGSTYLTDEEILGIEPVGSKEARRDSSGEDRPRNDRAIDTEDEIALRGEDAALGHKGAQAEAYATGAGQAVGMPDWMVTATAADPKNADAARELWAEHQEFRAAFASPTEARTFVQEARAVAEEARAIKELLPGGVRDIVSLREATQSVERIDAALFSGDARAQADVVAEMARVNPAAFRSMFEEAARVMAGLDGRGTRQEAGGREAERGDGQSFSGTSGDGRLAGTGFRENGEAWGSHGENFKSPISNLKLQNQRGYDSNFKSQISNLKLQDQNQNQDLNQDQNQNRRQDAGATNAGTNYESQITNHERQSANHPSQELRASQSQNTNHESQLTNHDSRGHQSPVTSHQSPTHQSPQFDPAAYAAFERATNDTVARDVRGSISDTLARVMPEGVAEGAARRIGEDIFGEVHRALAADRTLSEQVASVLRDPARPGGAARFGAAEQQRVAALVAGRAKQLVPSVARRVIGEWTSSVLNTARSKAARQAAAASRVDIAAPGGSSDSMPLRAMSAREVNYASMSDEQILGM